MLRTHTLIIICLLCCTAAVAQVEPDYFLANTESGQTLVYGTRFLINIPDDACYEIIEEYHISKGNKFIIMHVNYYFIKGKKYFTECP